MEDDRTKGLRLEGDDFKDMTVSRQLFEDVIHEFQWCMDKITHLMATVTGDDLHYVADTVIDILWAHKRRVDLLHENIDQRPVAKVPATLNFVIDGGYHKRVPGNSSESFKPHLVKGAEEKSDKEDPGDH